MWWYGNCINQVFGGVDLMGVTVIVSELSYSRIIAGQRAVILDRNLMVSCGVGDCIQFKCFGYEGRGVSNVVMGSSCKEYRVRVLTYAQHGMACGYVLCEFGDL